MIVALACHPATPTADVRGIEVRVTRTAAGVLRLRFVLAGTLSRLRIPAQDIPRFTPDLWRHTCFEAFVALEHRLAYHELNLAPSGAWAIFAFRRYRIAAAPAGDGAAPAIAVRTARGRLTLDAAMPLDRLSAQHRRATLRLGLSAVVEGATGALSYWALRHPRATPDFHDRAGFALRLEPLPPRARRRAP